jgi:hypothetical protein
LEAVDLKSHRSGFSLVVAGVFCAIYFWITDPRYGLALHWHAGENAIDLANQNILGTVIGLAGSVLVLFTGVWLLLRKST